jgi:hypothetical protein
VTLIFLAIVTPAVWVLWYFWRPWPVLMAAVILTLSLAGDAINVVHIRRRAKKDSSFLEEKVPGA